MRAVEAYREQFCDLPANLAGGEVAAILRGTSWHGNDDDGSPGLQRADGMEYVEPA